MKRIRVLQVVFDTEINGWEIPAFRGAIIQKAGEKNILFHNHLGNNTFMYNYPLIQYKTIGKRPAIICVDSGVDEIHKYFENQDWSVNISGRNLDMKIHRLNMNQFTMQVWDKKWDYGIVNWIALNQENYRKYLDMESLVEQIAFLEQVLKGNILSFAKGIDWEVDKPIEVKIKKIDRTRAVKLKGNKVIGFTLYFRTNVFIPNYIGLGKGTSVGFGMVMSIKDHSK